MVSTSAGVRSPCRARSAEISATRSVSGASATSASAAVPASDVR
ncbi:hypothetical protein MBRU_16335 [Mycolicibacterium brumae DSM 44177]|nr:hypothetical protein MBRU_16335 [Mycolicibacterium brumae DSM 44177]